MDADAVREPLTDPDLLSEVTRFAVLLRGAQPGTTEAEVLARITAPEELNATIVSAQARESVAFEELRRHRDQVNNVALDKCGVRAGEKIGLAKKVSPGAGRKFLSISRAIVSEMPTTFKALASGEISEDKARIMVEETARLPFADRRKIDTRMRNSLGQSGVRSLRTEARALAAEMNAEAAAERAKRAADNRRVSMTPIDDGMGRITAIIPLPQAVAVVDGLRAAADSVFAGGQARGRKRQQVLADTLVERLTGQETAESVPTQVHLVVEAESLFSDGMVPAWMPGHGPLPAKTARNFIAANEAEVFVRRMFTRVTDGQLVGMESKSRSFTGSLRQMVVFRDDVCRTPWCDAPIKHADHAQPHADGGETSWENGSGLCAACNYAKEHPGWKHEASAEGLRVTTPSGRRYEVPTGALVRRMRYPRAAVSDAMRSSPGERTTPGAGTTPGRGALREGDWRLQLSGLLEPQKSPPLESPPPESPPPESPPPESPPRVECDIAQVPEPVPLILVPTPLPAYRLPGGPLGSHVEEGVRTMLLDTG